MLAASALWVLSTMGALSAEASSVMLRSFAGGALRFDAVPLPGRTARSKTTAIRTARKELPAGTAAPTPEVFFARYTIETTERVATGTAPLARQARNVWVVRFPRVRGQRRSAVIVRANLPTIVPVTTIARDVTTDVLVVVDDQSGEVLLRSEFAPEQPAMGSLSALRPLRPLRSLGR